MGKKVIRYVMPVMLVFVFLGIVIVGYHLWEQMHPAEKFIVPQKTELVITTATGDAAWNKVMDEVAARFEQENQDIEIIINRDQEEVLYDDALILLDVHGRLGDVLEIRNPDFFRSGRLGTLPDEFYHMVTDVYEIDDKLYGLRMSCNSTGIIYNKSLFDSVGLEEPDTYADFLAVCETLKAEGYVPLALGGADIWHLQFLLESYYFKDVLLKNDEWDVQCRAGITSWQDEEVLMMLEDMKNLADSGYLESSWAIERDGAMPSKLASGQVGMLCAGPWFFERIQQMNPEIELGWFYIPDESGRAIAKDSGNSYWAITAECQEDETKYDAGMRFLKFLYLPETDEYINGSMGSMSTSAEADGQSLTPIQEEMREDFYDAECRTDKGVDDNHMPKGFRQSALTLIKEMLMGNYSARQTASLLQEAYEKCLDLE